MLHIHNGVFKLEPTYQVYEATGKSKKSMQWQGSFSFIHIGAFVSFNLGTISS